MQSSSLQYQNLLRQVDSYLDTLITKYDGSPYDHPNPESVTVWDRLEYIFMIVSVRVEEPTPAHEAMQDKMILRLVEHGVIDVLILVFKSTPSSNDFIDGSSIVNLESPVCHFTSLPLSLYTHYHLISRILGRNLAPRHRHFRKHHVPSVPSHPKSQPKPDGDLHS